MGIPKGLFPKGDEDGIKSPPRVFLGARIGSNTSLNLEFTIDISTIMTSSFILSLSAINSNITMEKITKRKVCSFEPIHTIFVLLLEFPGGKNEDMLASFRDIFLQMKMT